MVALLEERTMKMSLFANGFSRIYHFHLKKCGGTSMNSWLDQHVEDTRGYDVSWEGRRPKGKQLPNCWVRSLFFVADVVYDHEPIRMRSIPGTFCFTVLRSPRDRLLSQVSDWRRLNPALFRVQSHVRLPEACGNSWSGAASSTV